MPLDDFGDENDSLDGEGLFDDRRFDYDDGDSGGGGNV